MKPTKQRFQTGEIIFTRGVYDRMLSDRSFREFVQLSIGKYLGCDWGDTCDEDWKRNDEAIQDGNRIFAVYKNSSMDVTILIITMADRSITTVLFPHEY